MRGLLCGPRLTQSCSDGREDLPTKRESGDHVAVEFEGISRCFRGARVEGGGLRRRDMARSEGIWRWLRRTLLRLLAVLMAVPVGVLVHDINIVPGQLSRVRRRLRVDRRSCAIGKAAGLRIAVQTGLIA